jgi:hypothetical protein
MMILASRIYKRMVGMPMRELLVPKGADIGIFIETTNLFLINIRERLSASFFAKKPGT